MTVYVYPGPKDVSVLPSPNQENVSEALLDQHFQVCKQEIIRNHPDAKFMSESPCKIIQGKSQFKGKKAVFTLNYKFGLFEQESVSELYLFLIEPNMKFLVSDRYFVKARDTFPSGKLDAAKPELQSFLTALAWPTN